MPLPSLAVVVPVFNEEEVLPEFITRLAAVFTDQPEFSWTVIFVDDGSKDRSADLLTAATKVDSRVKLVQLSRNFGFQNALSAGLAEADHADAVITLDADLQDPPEIIPALAVAWRNGAEVVRAVRRTRQEQGLRRLGFDVFHSVFGRLTDYPIEPDSGTFCLLGRDALKAFNKLPERNRFFPGLRAWLGFVSIDVLYDRQERAAGKPQQTFRKLIRYALDGLFSFSHLPLRMLTYFGLIVASVGFLLGAFYAARRILGIETAVTGFTTLVTLLLFLGGIQLIGIGVLGEYLGRVYDEVKQRPNYIVRKRIGFD